MFNIFKFKKKNSWPNVVVDDILPFRFFTNCYEENFGYMGDKENYQFSSISEDEKKLINYIFLNLKRRLNVILNLLIKKYVSKNIFIDDEKLVYKICLEICFFDFYYLNEILEQKGVLNNNVKGAILDTIKWTFDTRDIFEHSFYNKYLDLQKEKLYYFFDVFSRNNEIKSFERQMIDQLYFKILKKPCTPFLVPDFTIQKDNRIPEKLLFIKDLIIGQDLFLKEIKIYPGWSF